MVGSNVTRRRSLRLAGTALAAGLAGCAEYNPLVDTPCEDVRARLQLLDDGKFEQAVAHHYPDQHDPEASRSSYVNVAKLHAATWGLPDHDIGNVECTCVEKRSPEEVRGYFEGSVLGWPYEGDLTAARIVRFEITLTTGESGTGLTLLFKIDGKGWYTYPAGAAAKGIAEECR